jgi:hypothetical protein
MLLDKYLPAYHFNEVHTTRVRADSQAVLRAVEAVTPAEIPLFRPLFWLRSLPARLAGRRRGTSFAGTQPVLDQVLRSGFVLLGREPDREVVLGGIGQFWRLSGGGAPKITSVEEFLTFSQPGYARAAMNFYVEDVLGSDGVTVRTETRVHVPDPAARRKFAAYWRIIYPGSALIRRMMLRAIKRRAEGENA